MTASPTPNIGTFEKVQVEYRKKQLVLFSYTFKHSVKSLGNIVNISSGSPVDEVWVNGIRYVAEKEEWGAWKTESTQQVSVTKSSMSSFVTRNNNSLKAFWKR